MCKYGNQMVVKLPKNVELRYNSPTKEVRVNVSIDECIVNDIKSLWESGIQTTGCCCGHNNKFPSFVSVEPECVSKMLELGYKPHQNINHFHLDKNYE